MEYTINLTKEEIDIILNWSDATENEYGENSEEEKELYDKLFNFIKD